jgi:hypothetical protein
MFTTCADGWRVAVGLADDDPSMVTAKLTRRVYLSRNRSQSSAATQPEPAAVMAWR